MSKTENFIISIIMGVVVFIGLIFIEKILLFVSPPLLELIRNLVIGHPFISVISILVILIGIFI